jgi:hypothetical protein
MGFYIEGNAEKELLLICFITSQLTALDNYSNVRVKPFLLSFSPLLPVCEQDYMVIVDSGIF